MEPLIYSPTDLKGKKQQVICRPRRFRGTMPRLIANGQAKGYLRDTEWVYAAMNADKNYNKKYPWGDSLVENGHYKANVWQGNFPAFNTVADGFAFASPVGVFGKSPLGLSDMGGNVWEWIQDWQDPSDTASPTSEKLQMSGSYLCDYKVCHGYKIGGTSHSTPETSLCHVGFRCVKDCEN